MLHRFTALFALFIAVAAGSAAAQDGVVTGRVIDAETSGPLSTATVELRSDADSSLVTGAAADEDGRFRIRNVSPGEYYVRVGFVGYASEVISDVSVSAGSEIDLGEVALEPETAALDEVQVSAERQYMEFGVDRTIYNVQDQPVSMGGSASDALEQIPSVEIDIDGNISLRGSQGVTVYLNGKPAPMSGEALTSFLRGLSAADIERVEVIPNPSAAYEPEGTAGILNIVLTKERGIGFGGGAQGSASTRGRFGASVNGHYGTPDVNVFANYGMRYGSWEESGWRYRVNRFLDPTTSLRQEMESSSGGLSHNFNASMDYVIDDKTTLSLFTVLSSRGNEGEEEDAYVELDENENPFERYLRLTDETDTDFSQDYRLDLNRIFKPRVHEITFEARFETDSDEESEVFTQRMLPLDQPDAEGTISERQNVEESETESELEIEADYERPLLFGVKGEFGLETDVEWVDNTFFSETADANGDFVPDTRLNNTFSYAERQYSSYAVLSREIGRFGIQLGLRFEHADTDFDLHTTGEKFSNNYTSLFPSGHISYKLSEKSRLQAAYTKRVRRPSEWQLNPYGDYGDPTSRREGNPYLTPEYTHSGELSYRLLGEDYTVTMSPYLRYTVDEISWLERITDEGVTILTFQNFDTESSYGAELVTSLSLGDWLKGELSANVFKQVTEAGNLASELSNDAIGFRSRLTGTVDVGAGLKLQLSQYYRSPHDIPGGRIAAATSTDVALRQEWMSGRVSVGLEVEDVFGREGFMIERDMERYYQEYFRDEQERNLQFSLRYTLPGSRDRGGGERRGGWRGRR